MYFSDSEKKNIFSSFSDYSDYYIENGNMLLEILHLIASTAIELNVDTVRIVDDWSIPMMKGLCLNTYGWYFSSCLERARLASEVSTVFVGQCEPPPRISLYSSLRSQHHII